MPTQEPIQKFTLLGFIIWFIGVLFFVYEFFLRTFVGTLAKQIIPDLHLNAELFALLGTAYYMTYGAMQIPVGILCDKFGAKKIMIIAALICALATLFFAHSAGFFTAFLSRLLMGFGSSFAFVCVLVIAYTWFPRKYFAFFSGLTQFFGTMGPFLAAGPLIAVIYALHESWRLALSEVSIFGIVLAILIFFIVKNKPAKGEFQVHYLRRHEPLKTQLHRLVRNPQAWFIAFYSASVYVSIELLAAVWGTEYLQVRGFSQTTAAYIISLSWIGYAIGCPLLGAISDSIKRRKPIFIFSSALGLIAVLYIVFWYTANPWVFRAAFFCLGIAAAGPNIGFAAITEQVDANVKSTALGLNNGMCIAFAGVFPLLVGWFIDLSSSGDMAHLTVANFRWGFLIMPFLYIFGLIISIFFIKETYAKPQKEATFLSITDLE